MSKNYAPCFNRIDLVVIRSYIELPCIHIWKRLIKSVDVSKFFLPSYFTYFADLFREQSKFFVQQIFVLHTFQENSVKFLISSFLAASCTLWCKPWKSYYYLLRITMSLNSFYSISHFNSMQSTVEDN